MRRDRLFIQVIHILVGLIVAYGLGITLVMLFVQPDESVVLRFISSFGTIFAGILGLCTGYLIGTSKDEPSEKSISEALAHADKPSRE